MGTLIFQDILIIFFTSILVILLLRALRLPAIIGFIVTGALIGPSGIALIHETEQIHLLAEVGITLLLFAAGMEFSLSSMARLKTYVLKGGTLQVGLTLLAAALVGKAIGWPTHKAVYFGCMVSLSSTAIVLSALAERRLQESIQGRIETGILILQDLAVIPMLILLPAFGREAGNAIPWEDLARQLGLAFALMGVTYLFIRHLAHPIFRFITRWGRDDLFLITIISLALGMSWITYQMGLSFAFGAFLGGLMIGATEYKAEAFSEIKPFRLCFNSLFFISIGMILDLRFLAGHLPLVGMLVLLIPALKMALITLILIVLKAPLRISIIVGISLAQIGEFAFLLASIGRKARVIDGNFYQTVVAVTAISMLLTPLMIQWAPRIASAIARMPAFNRWKGREDAGEGEDLFSDHVIVCGYGHVGQTVARIFKKYRIPHRVIELNPEVHQPMLERGEPILFGDAASPEVLHHAGIERARLLVITSPDPLTNAAITRQAKKISPDLAVITRTRHSADMQPLQKAGAESIVPEDLETGLQIGRVALSELGYPDDESEEDISQVRQEVCSEEFKKMEG